MTHITRIIAAILIGTAGLAAAHALAQGPGPGYGMGPGTGMGPGYGMGPGMMGGGTFDTGWLDTAKTKLGITADQDKAWTAYADSVRANAQSMQDMHNGMDPAAIQKMSPEDRQQFMQGVHDSRVQQMAAVSQARDGLFKVLGDQQKQQAPTLLGPGGYGPGPCGAGRGGMMGYGYGPGGCGRGGPAGQ